jgi:hypothetical protein
MVASILCLTAGYPLLLAWRASRGTTLLHASAWALAAWAAWLTAFTLTALESGASAIPARYVALCLTACAGVAVLGARRPGAGVWNFVVTGLLAVLLLPIAEGLGSLRLDAPRSVFLAMLLAIGILNYVPTRFSAAVICLAIGCGIELVLLAMPRVETRSLEHAASFSRCLLAASPWFGLIQWRSARPPASTFDQIWLDFRDRYGLVWSQRTREQFNRAAANAGWPLVLRWRGLRMLATASPLDEEVQTAAIDALRALLKRFGRDEES